MAAVLMVSVLVAVMLVVAVRVNVVQMGELLVDVIKIVLFLLH